MVTVKTITTATPSVAPPPMPVHLVEKAPDPDHPGKFLPGSLAEVTLCGEPWDRLSGNSAKGEGATCRACLAEARRRAGGDR